MKYLSKKTILISCTAFFMQVGISNAQQGENFVENGSFEETDGKAKKLGSIESAMGWSSPTGARADLFTPSKNPEIDVPLNIYGKEDAKEGSNYAGIVGYSFGDKIPRTYIMSKLTTPLKKGLTYCVKFSVNMAEASKYSSNNIGALLAAKAITTDSKTAIIEKASVLHPDNKVFTNTFGWETVCMQYIAEGGEKFITIGNFETNDKIANEKTKKIELKVNPLIAAYYYIDDVSVTLVDETSPCDCLKPTAEKEFSSLIYQKAIAINDKMSPKEKIQAEQLFFAFGKYKITPIGEQALDLIVEQMKLDASIKVEIQGYTTEAENKAAEQKPYMKDLDKRRIEEVAKYLVSKGVAESRLISNPKGAGNESPDITPEDDEELKMAKNRRITFVVM